MDYAQGARAAFMEQLWVSEQLWGMADVWETGGKKCCHFQDRKMGESTLVENIVERIFKDVLRVYQEQVKPHVHPLWGSLLGEESSSGCFSE